MAVVHLIRHPNVHNPQRLCYGQSEMPLIAGWEDYCSALDQSNMLAGLPVISSPAERCLSLARQISQDIITDPRLMELNFGRWEVQAWNNIPRAEIDYWAEDYIGRPAGGGESYLQVYSRVSNCLRQYLGNYDSLVVICHAGPIRAALADLLRLRLRQTLSLEIPFGKILTVDTDSGNLQKQGSKSILTSLIPESKPLS